MGLADFRGTPFPVCPPGHEDHVYKEAHGVKIPLRIWRAEGKKKAPWVLWIHGGGFIAGKYSAANAWVVPGFTARGYHVVSVAYRFMPQVGLDDMVGDCRDAFAWCYANLPAILGDAIDVDRYVAAGDSAGGYLAAQLALDLTPAPSATVLVYAAVDFQNTALKRSQPKAVIQPTYHRPRTDAELEAAFNDQDPANAEFYCPWDGDIPPVQTVEKMNAFLGTVNFEVTEKHYLRLDLNKYIVAHGKDRLSSLFRLDPTTPDAEFDAVVKKVSPLHELDGRSTFPPTFFMHGVVDGVVDVSQANQMAAKLKAMGVPTGHAYDQEGNHCYEIFISGPQDDGWDELIVPALDFVDQHVM